MAPRPFVLHFSLNSVLEKDRDEALREVFGRGLVNMDFRPLTREPMLEATIRLFPEASVATGRHSPHIVSSFDLSREKDDFLLAWPAEPARGRMRHLGREIEAREAMAVLTSCADHCSSETRSEVRPVNVRLSRKLLTAVLPDAEARLMRPIRRETPALRLLNDYVHWLLREDRPTDPELDRTISLHLADLVALASGTGRDHSHLASRRGASAARLAAAKTWALEHLREPELSVTAAAGAQGVSPRHIQKLFEADGTSFSAFLLSGRLSLVRRQLCNPLLASRPISAIAYDAGFGDLSYFNRAFRKAYGETPSDLRHRARSEAKE